MEHNRIWASLDTFLEGGDILGRKVAGEGFLRALLEADPFDSYHFFPESNVQSELLRARLQDEFPRQAGRRAFAFFPRHTLPTILADRDYHCFHLSDFLTHTVDLERVRNKFSRRIFPITGTTHSLSYARYMPALLGRLWPGTSPRDAILATSRSAVAVLRNAFADLRTAYNLSPGSFPAPGIRRIPLSVPVPGPAEPAAVHDFRVGLGLEDAPLILTLARFAPHSKMDLLPALEALKRAASLGLPAESVYVAAGWADAGDALPQALEAYAAGLGLRMRVLLRPDAETVRLLYSAADIFLSPSDNIQETFGLTLAEAASYGLPVVASDFDGYRDIVEHEITGLLAPTLGCAVSTETNTLAGLWFDNQYHLKLSQSCAVHVPALAEALARLGADRSLRERMGEAGRKRALEHFSWQTVIKRYVALWDELAARPLAADVEQGLRAARHPQLMRFGEFFHGHFSQTVDARWLEDVWLRRTATGDALYRGLLPLAHYAGMERLLDAEAVRRMLVAARKPMTGADLMRILHEYFPEPSPPNFVRERAIFTLIWALKHDYLEYAERAENG